MIERAQEEQRRGLLAVDLGKRMGLAYFGDQGQLCWYRSFHVGSRESLKGLIWGQLSQIKDLTHLVMEGDAALARLWENAAKKRFEPLLVRVIGADVWRKTMLLPREQRSGAEAKAAAIARARACIMASQSAPGSKALRHDTAEAIMIGLWGCHVFGLKNGEDDPPLA